MIVDRLDPFFEHEPGRLCIIENWTQAGRGIGNSSVFRFEAGAYPWIHENFVAEPDRLAEQYDNEQTYFTLELGGEIRFWPEAWCKSFQAPLPAEAALEPGEDADDSRRLPHRRLPRASEARRSGRGPLARAQPPEARPPDALDQGALARLGRPTR